MSLRSDFFACVKYQKAKGKQSKKGYKSTKNNIDTHKKTFKIYFFKIIHKKHKPNLRAFYER